MTVNFYVESLTRRELDVLRLLGENLSDREIADRLTLVLSSVKWKRPGKTGRKMKLKQAVSYALG